MVLLPGAASAQAAHSAQQIAGATGGPAVPHSDPPVVPPGSPGVPPAVPPAPGVTLPGNGVSNPHDNGVSNPHDVGGLLAPKGSGLLDGLLGSHDREGHHDGDDHHDGDGIHDNSRDSNQISDPRRPDHASGAVADIDLLKSHLLDITKYDATIEDNDKAHSDSTVLGLGGSRIIGSSASSEGRSHEGDNGDVLKVCNLTSGLLCLNLLYHNTVATDDHDSALAAARGGVAALCLGSHSKEATASYECNGLLSLGVAEGFGIAERDKEHGHTKAESANELLNLCLGKREKLTTPCEGLGLQAVHSDSKSKSDKPDTDRHSFLLGIDSNGKSSYLLDDPVAVPVLSNCGDSALLCLLLNQGKSVIFHNPKGAGSAQEALRLDVLNRTLLVVLGQAETLAHETEGHEHGKGPEHGGNGEQGNNGEEHGNGSGQGGGPQLAQTGAEIAPLLAGGFLLTGLGALTVAATRRRVGKHSI
ncbi:MAG: hypothetical protein ACRDQ4_05040 [Pseudonocardiaceae bacterium]